MARGNGALTRGRLCAIAFLVSLYLFGIALLASLSLDTNRRGFGGHQPSNSHHSGSGSRPSQDAGLGSLGLIRSQGIHTGSVYKDIGLLKSGFPAESVANGSVLVVKTHEWGAEARAAFHAAILLIRSPREAIHAEFNRQGGGHVGYAAPSIYRRMGGVYWSHFVEDKARVWRQTNLDWLYNFTGPHHLVFYEDLVHHLEPQLRELLRFLNVPVSEEQLQCALERSEGIFRRKKRSSPFNPFSEAQIQMLENLKRDVYKEIENYNKNQIKSDYDTDRVQRS